MVGALLCPGLERGASNRPEGNDNWADVDGLVGRFRLSRRRIFGDLRGCPVGSSQVVRDRPLRQEIAVRKGKHNQVDVNGTETVHRAKDMPTQDE